MKQFKKLFRSFCGGLGIIHRLDPWKIPVLTMRALAASAVPFAVIAMSAGIINKLSAGADFRGTLTYALVSIALIFTLTLLGDYLKKTDEVKSRHICRLYEYSKSRKLMDLDFTELESPDAVKLRAKLRAEENMGFNLPLLFSCLDTLAESLFTAVLSLGFFLYAASNTAQMPAAALAGFLGVSAALSVTAAMLLKKLNDKIMAKIKDDKNWPDSVLQNEAMAYGGIFNYKSGKDVRIYGFQDKIRGCFTEGFQYLLNISREYATGPAFAYGGVGAVRGLIMGGSFVFAAILMNGEGTQAGTLLLIASVLYQFTAGISKTIIVMTAILSIAESLQMYVQFMDASGQRHRGTLPVEKRSDNEFEIEFCNVSFKYPGEDKYALKNLNLKLNIGQRMAVVGMNGSGKTTMIKLLCRLYDPTEGKITLNGIDIKKYDYQEYMSIFSVVFQDFRLFSFPLGQNVAASMQYDADRVTQALRKAGVSERASSMPDGLNTPLYKDFDAQGVEISGGEAQKIAIARALYKNSPFIVLDEPTAALDPIAEFEIYSQLNHIIENKTAVFISHRLSSCRFCHDIAVFHKGELVQRGGHEELLADKRGKYYELWNAQAQYYVS